VEVALYQLLGTQEDRFLNPGTRVRLAIKLSEDGMVTPQSGVVIHCWHDDDANCFQSMVAFFGDELPRGKPSNEPYIVQHKATSLEEISGG
jgi:hypothetical protein